MAGNKTDAEMAELAAVELGETRASCRAIAGGAERSACGGGGQSRLILSSSKFEPGRGARKRRCLGGICMRCIANIAEARRYRFDVSDFSTSDRGGFKEVIVNVRGDGAFRRLHFEGGGHRVQRCRRRRQGRIHTSAATVAVLPEMPDVKIEINPKDVEEFGCRGGGPGGQNVNKVETGWRIMHKPSGLQFKMTEHKSQTQNKERAWALLRATLYEREQAKQHAALTSRPENDDGQRGSKSAYSDV